jgi:hypothetical protein
MGPMGSDTQTLFSPHLQGPKWFGAPGPESPPGDITSGLAVLVADAGLGYADPIAIDYRMSWLQPRVITFRWSVWGEWNRRVFIAPDVMTFAELIEL